MCTPIVKIVNHEELCNSSIVKVVVDTDYNALYFSRAAIPFIRDIPINEWISYANFYKHVGIYCYTHIALEQFVHLPIGILEQLEKLEQLRMLENHFTIHCCVIDEQSGFGIDTPLDLEKARLLIQ
jgi:3-deoxy-manno-octulosonate cytidylyltransferase (CMP-KDO synthetase)